MTLKTKVERTFHFRYRKVAIECVVQSLAKPNVTRVSFVEQTWYPKDDESRFEVVEVSDETD
jgi:hypothetical protein